MICPPPCLEWCWWRLPAPTNWHSSEAAGKPLLQSIYIVFCSSFPLWCRSFFFLCFVVLLAPAWRDPETQHHPWLFISKPLVQKSSAQKHTAQDTLQFVNRSNNRCEWPWVMVGNCIRFMWEGKENCLSKVFSVDSYGFNKYCRVSGRDPFRIFRKTVTLMFVEFQLRDRMSSLLSAQQLQLF